MITNRIYILLLFLNFTACSQSVNTSGKNKTIAIKGQNIIDQHKIRFIASESDFGKITKIKGKSKNDFSYKVETIQQPKFIYTLSTKLPLITSNYEKNRIFLLSFKAKSIESELETGEAKVLFQFQQSDSYKDNLETTLSLASEWSTYHVQFQSTKDISANDLGLVLQYGYRPQAFIIKDIEFEVFPLGIDKNKLPKTKISYSGIEPNAQWRKDAFQRIEKIRKGDFELYFTKNGIPVKNTKVKIKLIKHAFPFGAAIRAKDVVNNTQNYINFKRGFTYVVLENDLKIKSWKNKKRRAIALKALDILQKDNIDVKGHVLIWPGLRYLPPTVRENKDNPEKVKKIMLNHVRDILSQTKGKVSRWDVVNEAYTNKDLQEITGSEKILFQGFRITKSKSPEVERFTNEYGIISKGGIDTKKQKWYYDYIQRIDDHTGGLVDGIGIQCHMGSDLTSPERILEILDIYSKLNKKISISEFTMDLQDEEIRAKYTRDFMITAFSHPKISEFLFWGCTRDSQNKVDIFKEDGSLGTMGKVYFDLVYNIWKTELTRETNSKGMLDGRGFYGTYKYQLFDNGKIIEGKFELEKGQKPEINIEIN